MKFVFIVQGEGRGHMTQAISLLHLLSASGHEVTDVLIGKSNRRSLPEFVKEQIQTTVHQFDSPNFVADKKEKSINIIKTIQHNITNVPKFRKSLRLIHDVVQHKNPHVIVNFYDQLAGIYNALYRPKADFIVIGHQYLIAHPAFSFVGQAPLQKLLFRLNTKLTALGAKKYLALSFRKLPESSHPKLEVIPPLLRPQLKKLNPSNGDFLLTYMVNAGYAEDLITFGKAHSDIKVEAFWDQKDMPNPYRPITNITFYYICDLLFLEKMAACKGLITTAGFESICEAMYLGKKVMMVPIAGQYEQACNALDGEISGAGIVHHTFDLKLFDDYLGKAKKNNNHFMDWQNQLPEMLGKILENLSKKDSPKPVIRPATSLPLA